MQFKVKIEDALTVLRKNLADHVVELKEATTGWIEQVTTELTTLKDAVDRQGLEASNDRLYQLFYAKPRDNRREYARYIGALERTQAAGETLIEMDEDDYDRMFNDNWDWRQLSKVSNASYTTRKN